jgi:hypothetical protein
VGLKRSLLIIFISLFLGNIALAGLGSPPKRKEIDFKEGIIRLPSYHRLNVPKGFKAAINDDALIALENLEVYLSDYAEPVAVIVPKDSSFADNSPYLVLVRYNNSMVRYKDLQNYNAKAFRSFVLENWAKYTLSDWIPFDLDSTVVNAQPKREIVLKGRYKGLENNDSLIRYHKSYWKFGSYFTYHYVFICPENQIKKYGSTDQWLEKLLVIQDSWYIDSNADLNFEEEKIDLEKFICLDDFGTRRFGEYNAKALHVLDSLDKAESKELDIKTTKEEGLSWVLVFRLVSFVLLLLVIAKSLGWIKFKR